MQKTFSIIEIFWYAELFPNKIFRYHETKILDKNRDTPPFFIKTYKALVELMFVENLRKLDFKQ